jgi:HD-GYP domain-containing protein (c-di-GMP phosphodiesterase class II)
MMETVKTEDLQMGMYVLLPKNWFNHPFLKNEFLIENPKQITKIVEVGITEVVINTDKSDYRREEPVSIPHVSMPPLPIVPVDLQEAIFSRTLPVTEKAKIIHKHSAVMVQRLMKNPSASNLIEAKLGIAEIVDIILADDKTNEYLLNITSHDYNTYIHSVNVGVLGVSLAKKLFKKSDAHNMHELGAGFFLHDLGKVKIDINIINKPAVLSNDELLAMRLHPQHGYEILKQTRQLTQECKKIVLQHHERENGTGYPLGLKGEEIHLYGRICSLADVYDALNSSRPYRQGVRPFDALNIMKEEMLDHFHKELFQQFVLLFK